MSKNSGMHDDVIYTWYDPESDKLFLKRNGAREEVPSITRDYIRDLNDQMNALCEYVVKLEQTNIVLDSDNTELLNDARDMQMIVTDNDKLRKLVKDFDKCLTEAVRLAYIQGHATIYDGTLLNSLHPRMRELGIEV